MFSPRSPLSRLVTRRRLAAGAVMLAVVGMLLAGERHSAPAPQAEGERAPLLPVVARQGDVGSFAVRSADGAALYWLEPERNLVWTAGDLAAADVAATSRQLDASPARLLVRGDRLLVTLTEPGQLLVLDARSLDEVSRVALPRGASAMASVPETRTVLVSSSSGRVTAVDWHGGRVLWTAEVPAEPLELVVSGSTAFVSHRRDARLTRLDGVEAEPRVTRLPALARPSLGESGNRAHAFDPRLALSPDGARVLALRAVAGTERSERGARVDVLDAAGAPRGARLLPASVLQGDAPRLTAPVALVPRRSVGTTLALGAEAILEIDAGSPGAEPLASHALQVGAAVCAAPRGLVLSAAETVAHVVCADRRLAELSLAEEIPYLRLIRYHDAAARACSGAGPGRGAPTVGSRHHTRYPSAEGIADIVREYACRYPDRAELLELGTSHGGRPIVGLAIGRGADTGRDRPALLLNGGHHGDEQLSLLFVLDAIETLLETGGPAVERYLDALRIVAVPLVNPDGYEVAMRGVPGRKNGRDNDGDGHRGGAEGVDINRNYPFRWAVTGGKGSSPSSRNMQYRGPAPASEPETQAIMRLAERERFVGAISYHTGTLAVLVPYTIPGVKSPTPNVAAVVAQHVAHNFAPHPEGKVGTLTRLYPIDGNDQDWHMFHHGTVALLVEGSSFGIRELHRVPPLLASVRSSWTLLADRYLTGPSIGGRVVDAAGQPVIAEVRLGEVQLREGERWTTRCHDGRFDRYVPWPGRYTVRIEAPGLAPVERVVELGYEHVELDVELPGLVDRPADCRASVRKEAALLPLPIDALTDSTPPSARR